MLDKARKSRVGVFFVALALGSLYLTSSASPIQAQSAAAPNIAFLNPSSFASNGTTIVVSDTAPNKPEGASESYKLSAWVSNAPTDAIVEFEVRQVSVLPGAEQTTVEAQTKLAGNTFEGEWSIPEDWSNGTYEVIATLYTGGLETDTARVEVQLTRPAAKAHISYPTSDAGDAALGRWGTFYPLGSASTDRSPKGRIGVNYTDHERGAATTFVRTFYTTSSPGQNPSWTACGTEKTGSHPILPNDQAADGVRCRLNSSTDQSRVTAVAAVANSSTGPEMEAQLNGAGDVLRVTTPYAQTPSKLTFVEGGTGESVDLDETDDFPCHQVELSVADQYQLEILGANVDVHAWGPGDDLWFNTGRSAPDSVQAPDRGTHAREDGYDCLSRQHTDQAADDQGEHGVTGGPDLKHVESAGSGTSDTGGWVFELKPDPAEATGANHTTQFVVWIDEQNDGRNTNNDTLDSSEVALCGSVGFGGSPESPVGTPVIALEECTGESRTPTPTTTPTASASSSPSTSPSTSPTPTTRADRSISLSAARLRGTRFAFSGRVTSEEQGCARSKVVRLQKRTLDNRWKTVQETKTDVEGNYRMTRRVRKKTRFRALAPATEDCARAVSSGLIVKPRTR